VEAPSFVALSRRALESATRRFSPGGPRLQLARVARPECFRSHRKRGGESIGRWYRADATGTSKLCCPL